jgi:cation-transporting P-type ATPase E
MTVNYPGLTSQDVATRLAQGAVNRSPKFTTRTYAGILRSNVLNLFNGLLLVSIIALLLIHAYTDAWFLFAVTFFNTIVGVTEEIRAKIALDRLAILHKPAVKVLRDQQVTAITVDDVVVDDVIFINSGDQVVADGELLSTAIIALDESLLTGESDPIYKKYGDQLFSGSFCSSGSGVYRATQVGAASAANKLTAQAKSYKISRTPLQKDINGFVEALTGIMFVFVILLVLASVSKNISVSSSVLAIVTVIKSFVPQGLILFSTLAFALGAIRIARRHVLVQKLNAIEAMSNVTTLCLDKTGTLGANTLLFEQLYLLSSDRSDVEHKLKLFTAGVKDKNRSLLAIAKAFTGEDAEVLAELPFSSQQKCSALQIRDRDQEYTLWLGAPEILAAGCLTTAQIEVLRQFRERGLRVLLFAASPEKLPIASKLESLAFIVLRDELRPNVAEAIKYFQSRDVAIKILSGDHPDTIAAIAQQSGITVTGEVINGNELVNLNTTEMVTKVARAQLFGNLVPKVKKQIIQALQMNGENVGMVGDGVNDVLALKQADIGVAMNSGATAARDVADIVLLQDSFAHLPALPQEGDRIIYNIKRLAKLFITKNVYCFFYILFVGFVGLNFPLSPRYITWIDFLTIGMPTAILMFMVPVLSKQTAKQFTQQTLRFAFTAGLTIAFFSLLTYVGLHLFWGRGELISKTASAVVIIFMGLYLVYRVAKNDTKQNLLILGVIAVAIAVNGVALTLDFARQLLGMAQLGLDLWGIIIIVSLLGVGALRLFLGLLAKNARVFAD